VRHPGVPGADDVIAAFSLGRKLARTRRAPQRQPPVMRMVSSIAQYKYDTIYFIF
jgi:hypothetical protein